ncbi:MAG: ribonuclease Z [Rikenellaceae bacterium]
MSFNFTILGSFSALPSVNRHPSAHVFCAHEQFYLIDCGEGAQVQLKRYGFNLLKINHIFISHLHGDHFYGIYGLISTMSLMGRKTALTIYAPSPLKEIIKNHCDFFEQNISYEIICIEISTDTSVLIYENKVLEVYSIPLKHKIPTSGFLFKEKTPSRNVYKDFIDNYALDLYQIQALKRGEDIEMSDGELLKCQIATYYPYRERLFAYCSDTAPSKEVSALIRGADLLYHESTFLEIDKKIALATGHSTAKGAAFIASFAEVKQLVIGHFSSRYKGDFSLFYNEAKEQFDNVLLAEEGKTYKIPKLSNKQ